MLHLYGQKESICNRAVLISQVDVSTALFRHMKINNKSKVAMNIFHQARRRIALIARLLGQFADAA